MLSWLVSDLPAQEPISYEEVRDGLRIDGDDEFKFITEAAISAREYCEKYLNRAVVEQEVTANFDGFTQELVFWLPFGSGLLSVTSVTYIDTDGNEQVLDTNVYILEQGINPGGLYLLLGKSWPTTQCQRNAVKIIYRVGFCLASEVTTTNKIPRNIKSAIILLVGDLFNNRAAQHDFALQANPAVKSLLAPYRVRGF